MRTSSKPPVNPSPQGARPSHRSPVLGTTAPDAGIEPASTPSRYTRNAVPSYVAATCVQAFATSDSYANALNLPAVVRTLKTKVPLPNAIARLNGEPSAPSRHAILG